jgi:hypothetical protein
MKKEEFAALLQSHDWYYQHSDDPAAYQRGATEANRIRTAAAADPQLQALLDEFRDSMNSPRPEVA